MNSSLSEFYNIFYYQGSIIEKQNCIFKEASSMKHAFIETISILSILEYFMKRNKGFVQCLYFISVPNGTGNR